MLRHTTNYLRVTCNHKSGFTMLEVVLTLAIGAVLAVICAMTLGLVGQTETRIRSASEATDQSTQLLSFITRELRTSQTINSPTSGDSAETILYLGAGEVTPSSFSLHDNVLWWSDNGAPEYRLSNNKVSVDTFLAENFAVSGSPGSIRISLGLAEASEYQSGNLAGVEQLFSTSVTTRSLNP